MIQNRFDLHWFHGHLRMPIGKCHFAVSAQSSHNQEGGDSPYRLPVTDNHLGYVTDRMLRIDYMSEIHQHQSQLNPSESSNSCIRLDMDREFASDNLNTRKTRHDSSNMGEIFRYIEEKYQLRFVKGT